MFFIAAAESYRAFTARGMIPALSPSPPVMVHVFPDPVWPYAKMHTLYPSRQLWMRFRASSNTSAWVLPGWKAASNWNAFTPRAAVATSRAVSSVNRTTSEQSFSFSYAASGRHRAKTRIFPFMSSIMFQYFFRSFISSVYLRRVVSCRFRGRLHYYYTRTVVSCGLVVV